MTWNCHACTYANINDSSTLCHMCNTDRPSVGAPQAIVDLTEICSPKPTAAASGRQKNDEGNNNSMESNRSRRRRRQEQESLGKEGEPSTSNDKRRSRNATSTSADTSFPGKEKAKEDYNANGTNAAHSASRVDHTSRSNQKSYPRADSGPSQNSNKSENKPSSVIGADSTRRNNNASSANYSNKPRNSVGERNGGGTNESRNKVMKAGNDDILMDPAPRKKLPLNINNGAGFEPGKRRESKLKKKRIADADINGLDDVTDSKMRSPPKNTDSKRRKHSLNNDDMGEAKMRRKDARAFSGSNENDHRKQSFVTGADSYGNKHSSAKSGSTSIDARNGQKENTFSQPRQPRLNIFFNQQKQPHTSPEDLMERAKVILQQTFGHKSLRKLQETAVKDALRRKSQIVIMATGGGKSMCYQLPALAAGNNSLTVRAEDSSVTIVVCPLIALMIDQVNNLHRKGVHTAACLSSTHTAKAKQEILNRLQTDRKGKAKNPTDPKLTPIQLLYCTPELIETERFRGVLSKLYESNRLHMLAIDEAHCLSTWGHDFRPAFKKLTWVREAFPDVPVMACTGTATAKVIQDIRDILRFNSNVPCIMGTFNRPNLSYEVRFKDSLNTIKPQGAMIDLAGFVKKQHAIAKKANQPCSGICYVHKRDDCKSLAIQISKATGLVCLAYHAGLKDSEREETQRKWTAGDCSIAVATVAFGMGIDLPHVRYVIHWTMAKSLEGFYQESGRGGRDGKPSLSILYYSKDDAGLFAFLARKNAERAAAKNKGNRIAQKVDNSLVELEKMTDYCTKPICKRKFVLAHFGETIDASTVCKQTCDYCKNPQKVESEIQAAECMTAVANSHRLLNHGKAKGRETKKFHHNPLDDEERRDYDNEPDDFFGSDEGRLGITNYTGNEMMASGSMPKKGFVKASSVLGKYETLECQQGKKGGFVNFKTKTFDEPSQEDLDTKKHRAINIPDHLRKNAPDPLAVHKKAPNSNKPALKSSSSYASEAEKLKAELEELRKQREAALAKMGGSLKSLSSRSSSKPLPTPSLSFKRRR